METYDITLIPGDGIGPEISAATQKVLEATGIKFNWDVQEAGEKVLDKYGTPLPDHVIDSIKKNKIALKGPITTPVGSGFRSVNVALRQSLDLYANVRPSKTYPGVHSNYKDVDLVVVRENTEDLYAGVEIKDGTTEVAKLIDFIHDLNGQRIAADSAISIKAISQTASRRIAKYAFDYARANNRKKVTAVHKANIMKFSDGLFLECAREVAREYPDIAFEDRIVDNMAMQLVQKPEIYDVLVMPNLYGDIISDLCAGLVGGLGMAPGANIGANMAVFEPAHGSAPKYAGQNKANPMAMMLTGVMMLQHIGEHQAAKKLQDAVAAVIAEGKLVTYDIKGNPDDPAAVGTSVVADAVIDKLNANG